MADREFSLGPKKFKLSKVNALKQYHLVRRISPILADLLPVLKTLKGSSESVSDDAKFDEMAKIMTPIMGGLSKYSDKEAEMVLLRLLESVEIQQEHGNWTKIARDLNGEPTLVLQDLELPLLLFAAGRAFMFNLSTFFDVLQHLS